MKHFGFIKKKQYREIEERDGLKVGSELRPAQILKILNLSTAMPLINLFKMEYTYDFLSKYK